MITADSQVKGITEGQQVVIDPNLGCGNCRYCTKGLPNLCNVLKTRPIKSNGGFGEYVALDYRMVHPLPATITDAQATFIEPLSCALHAVKVAAIQKDENVAIFGGGMLGLLTAIVLDSLKKQFIVIEPEKERGSQLERLFDTVCLTPKQLNDYIKKRDFSVAIDCSGSVEAISQAIGTVTKSGTLVLAGVVQSSTIGVPIEQITKKELKLKGTWLNPDTFAEAIVLTEQCRAILDKLKTATFALDDIERAFECAEVKRYHKVFIRP